MLCFATLVLTSSVLTVQVTLLSEGARDVRYGLSCDPRKVQGGASEVLVMSSIACLAGGVLSLGVVGHDAEHGSFKGRTTSTKPILQVNVTYKSYTV